MLNFRRALVASTFAFALSAAGAAMAEGVPYEGSGAGSGLVEGMSGSGVGSMRPTALSSADRISYTTAFDALRRGDLEAARASASQAQDRVLMGQVEFERLFHRDHSATYEELVAWLNQYADLPCAGRVYNLALKRQPDGAAEPPRPAGFGRTWNSLVAAVSGDSGVDPDKIARVAYNNDDLSGAVQAGQSIGDWWTVGLASWRLNDFQASFSAFERVALDPTEDPWVRAGAAVWTARAAAKTGRQDRIAEYLRLAARWPATFYGQIALRQLGEEPVVENQGPRAYNAVMQQASFQQPEPLGVEPAALSTFLQGDARARRTLAFYEVGRRDDARSELRQGLRTAAGDTAQKMWGALARMMSPGGSGGDAGRIDAVHYPTPDLQPEGGFTIDRALVYALARKETGFDAGARSGAGAYGIMQVMPTTAAEMTGDRGFVSQPSRLLDPAVNMKLGQAYIQRMLQLNAFQGDVLRAVASYNAGPGPMLAALRKLGGDADPLLLIETIDVPQARDYVEKVMASYWIYQRLLGGPLKTLDAVASGASLIPAALDYVQPAPQTLNIALIRTAAVQ